MISGAHVVLFSADAEADRAFVRDVLGFPSVDAGGGWLIFRLPPGELAVHPTGPGPAEGGQHGGTLRAELYLMCEDLASVTESLGAGDIECAEVADMGWGLLTSLRLPSGGDLGLYQPLHPTALEAAEDEVT